MIKTLPMPNFLSFKEVFVFGGRFKEGVFLAIASKHGLS